ncbi:MAG: murein L,D-transpeptidase catalytic domain family protein [Agriterribacter sp.]
MRKSTILIITLLFIFVISASGWYYSRLYSKNNVAKIFPKTTDSTTIAKVIKLNAHIRLLAQRVNNKYNTDWGFFIDMSIESGKKRFFVVDLTHQKIIDSGLVTHGRCNENWLSGRKYSNEVGGGCTSLGIYKIGNSYNGRFGLAYKLYGLDSTNSNAFQRFVVLHSMECIPEKECFPYPICQSDGCPSVSPGFLKKLQVLLDSSSKPVLLYIYE